MTGRSWAVLGTSLALCAAATAVSQGPKQSVAIPSGIPIKAPVEEPGEPDVAGLQQRIENQRQADIREAREVADRLRSRVQSLRQQMQKAEGDLARAESLLNGLNQAPPLSEPVLSPMGEPPAMNSASIPGKAADPPPALPKGEPSLDIAPPPIPNLTIPADPPVSLEPVKEGPTLILPDPSPVSPVEARKQELDRQIEQLKAERAGLEGGPPKLP